MVPVLQQDLENGLDVCWYSPWIQHEMPFCNTPHKCFSAFQLATNDHTHNYHWVIQSATIQALTCQLKRKCFTHFVICREIFVPRKVGRSFQGKKIHAYPTKMTEIQLEDAKLTSLLLLSALQSQPEPPFCTCQILPLEREEK